MVEPLRLVGYFLPRTTLGRWSVGLFGVFFAMFLTFQLQVASGAEGGEAYFDNLALSIPITIGFVCVLTAGGLGVASVARRQERAAAVFAVIVFASLAFVFLAGELLFPHG